MVIAGVWSDWGPAITVAWGLTRTKSGPAAGNSTFI